MDCYTLGQALAHKTFAVAKTVYHPVHHTVGRSVHAARHIGPSVKSSVVRNAPRIACKPPAGFLAGLAKAAGVAMVGAPLLGSPTAPDSISGVASALGSLTNPGNTSSPIGDGSPAFASPSQTATVTAPGTSPEAAQTAESPTATPLSGNNERNAIASTDAPSLQPIPLAIPMMLADMPPAFGPNTNALIPPSEPSPPTPPQPRSHNPSPSQNPQPTSCWPPPCSSWPAGGGWV